MTTVSNQAAGITTTNGSSLGSFTVPAGGMVTIAISAAWSSLSVGSDFTVAFTGTMSGLTYSRNNVVNNVSSRRALAVYTGINTGGSDASGTIIATLSNTGGAGYQEHLYSVDLYAAIDTSTPINSGASSFGTGTTISGGTALDVPGGGDIVVLVGMHTSASSVISLGAELTNELSQTGGGGNVRRMIVAYNSAPDTTPSPTVTFTPSDDWACITFKTKNGTGGIGAAATAVTLTGPSGGVVSVASTNFTVGANGTITGTVTVTPSDGGGGGTFSPTSVAISSGTPTATFTYTPASTGVKTISCSDDGGLTDPSSISYTSTAGGSAIAARASNLYRRRRAA